MLLNQRLRRLRLERRLSQGDLEKTTGLRRQYISRVENGWTMPSLETLERLARALCVPLYRLFYEGVKPPKISRYPHIQRGNRRRRSVQAERHGSRYTSQLLRLMVRIKPADRKLLFDTALKMSQLHRSQVANRAAD